MHHALGERQEQESGLESPQGPDNESRHTCHSPFDVGWHSYLMTNSERTAVNGIAFHPKTRQIALIRRLQ